MGGISATIQHPHTTCFDVSTRDSNLGSVIDISHFRVENTREGILKL
jgi:hypothetical protein